MYETHGYPIARALLHAKRLRGAAACAAEAPIGAGASSTDLASTHYTPPETAIRCTRDASAETRRQFTAWG